MAPFQPVIHWAQSGRRTVSLTNSIQLPSALWWAAPPVFFLAREVRGCVRLALLSLCRRTPTWFHKRATHAEWFQYIMTKTKVIYTAKMTLSPSFLFLQTLRESLVMLAHTKKKVRQISPITHVTSYIRGFTCKRSASSLHNNHTAECWQCNWWNFTENRFRLWT